MINEEIARKTLNMEVKAAKVTGKLILNLLKKLMKEAEKLGGLEKLVNANGNEVKLKDMVKKGQLEEIPVEEAELKELKKELNRYGVKFSVMKDKETGKYSVFFQAKDMKVMNKAFKHALSESEKKTEKTVFPHHFGTAVFFISDYILPVVFARFYLPGFSLFYLSGCFTRMARKEFIIASMDTPTSAKTAIHMLA